MHQQPSLGRRQLFSQQQGKKFNNTSKRWTEIMLKNINKLMVTLFALVAFGLMASPAQAFDMNGWKKAVIKKVAKSQKYPRSALAREIEGKAKIRLTVDAAGTITNHEVVQETGEAVLDNEIPKLVDRLNPLPSLPDGKTELSFVLPLNWSLN